MKNSCIAALWGAVLNSCVLSAQALEPLADSQLSQVSGGDGITVVADLEINVGSVEFIDSDTNASLAFNDISVTGLAAVSVDIITSGEFQNTMASTLRDYGIDDAGGVIAEAMLETGYLLGSDVVQLRFPNLTHHEAYKAMPSVRVGSITTGNGGASMGSLAINNIDLGGTTVWIYGH